MLSFFLLFVQCKQDNYTSIESQKEVLFDDFLDLYLNNNPLYHLYDSRELTIQECEKIIQELNQGKELNSILPKYLSDKANVQLVYEFWLQTNNLAQKIRRYNLTETFLENKIKQFPIVKSRQEIDIKGPILTRYTFGRLNYNRCKRYCEDDYDACENQARRTGATVYTSAVILSMGAAPATGGVSIIFTSFIGGQSSE